MKKCMETDKMMKIMVTGASGQLGYDVMRLGIAAGYDIHGFDVDTLDISDEEAVKKMIAELHPDAVIHCGAYTAVDRAESEKELCFKVNAKGTEYVAAAAAAVNAKLIYISSDYVFNGSGAEPRQVTENRDPVNYYGLTKAIGEEKVMAAAEKYFIVRTSWVFGLHGQNFVKTMLRLGKEKEALSVVCDQVGSPTYTLDLASLLLKLVETEKYGIYHGTNQGFCSWQEFAAAIMEKAGLPCKVQPIETKDYPSAAKRPFNSRLDSRCLTEQGFSLLPSWSDALEHFLKELAAEPLA